MTLPCLQANNDILAVIFQVSHVLEDLAASKYPEFLRSENFAL